MKLHWLQHVPFEGLGIIKEWTEENGADLSATRLYAAEKLPMLENFDMLIIMGGPMGIYDHEEHPWLIEEKQFIRAAIDAEKTVLGICLGAQLIADVLGAEVAPGPQKEIGWFPLHRDPSAPQLLPENINAFHWHGDTFEIPDGAQRLASSSACPNQGFIYQDRVVGLQFHMEITEPGIEALIEHCGRELGTDNRAYVQTAEEMREQYTEIPSINTAMKELLNQLSSTV